MTFQARRNVEVATRPTEPNVETPNLRPTSSLARSVAITALILLIALAMYIIVRPK